MNRPDKPLQRTDLMDTSLAAHRRLIAFLRKMSPEQKILMTGAMTDFVRSARNLIEDLVAELNRLAAPCPDHVAFDESVKRGVSNCLRAAQEQAIERSLANRDSGPR